MLLSLTLTHFNANRHALFLFNDTLILMRMVLQSTFLFSGNTDTCTKYRQTDRQTMLVYFTWPTKRPGGHQVIYFVLTLP